MGEKYGLRNPLTPDHLHTMFYFENDDKRLSLKSQNILRHYQLQNS